LFISIALTVIIFSHTFSCPELYIKTNSMIQIWLSILLVYFSFLHFISYVCLPYAIAVITNYHRFSGWSQKWSSLPLSHSGGCCFFFHYTGTLNFVPREYLAISSSIFYCDNLVMLLASGKMQPGMLLDMTTPRAALFTQLSSPNSNRVKVEKVCKDQIPFHTMNSTFLHDPIVSKQHLVKSPQLIMLQHLLISL
jgi:hypothetical protein